MKPNNKKSREEFKKIPSVDSIISVCFNSNDINLAFGKRYSWPFVQGAAC